MIDRQEHNAVIQQGGVVSAILGSAGGVRRIFVGGASMVDLESTSETRENPFGAEGAWMVSPYSSAVAGEQSRRAAGYGVLILW